MTATKNALRAAPPLIKALADQDFSITLVRILNYGEEDENFHEMVWAEQIDEGEFRILTPVWKHEGLRYRNIVSVNSEWSGGGERIYFQDVIKGEGFETKVLLPKSPQTADDVFAALEARLAGSPWICEVLDNRLLVLTTSPEIQREHGPALEQTLKDLALVQKPGPWCVRFLEAAESGDDASVMAEFLIGNGDEDDDGGSVDQNDNAASSEAEKELAA